MMLAAGWAPLMAAMMLPGAVPALVHRRGDAPLFALAYFGVWLLVALVVTALYRPPSHAAAVALVVGGGAYELTPLKRDCRVRCHARARSGAAFGAACVGSSLGLLLILAGAGPMSMAWMVAIAAVGAAQKLVAPRAALDVPFTVALVAAALLLL